MGTAVTTMDTTGEATTPAGAGAPSTPGCATPPGPSLAARRFRNIAVASLLVTAVAWVALVLWGGAKDMRRGLLTGGPALMSSDSMGAMGHAGHDASMSGMDMADMSGMSMPGMGAASDMMPDFTATAPPPGTGHSMTMLGIDMGNLAPASVGYAGLFLWMWTVMVVAMMLPATLPSVRVFLVGDRKRTHCAGATFLSGCLLTWAVAGVAVYGVMVALDAVLPEKPSTESRFALAVGAVGLLAAGLFQFSRSKESVLSHVRGPFSCGEGSLRAGLHHGRRCLASCGPYMLAVALIGMMSIFWMAVFALVMLAEQVAEIRWSGGLVVARATGAVAVLVAMGLLLSPTPLPLIG